MNKYEKRLNIKFNKLSNKVMFYWFRITHIRIAMKLVHKGGGATSYWYGMVLNDHQRFTMR